MSMTTQDNIKINMTPVAAIETLHPADSNTEELDNEQLFRAGSYGLLATLLRATPTQTVLEQVEELAAINQREDELSLAMTMLGLAARSAAPDSINDEYHALFIGLGRGELVPFASWYLTGFLMEKPLAILRDDLSALGFERQDDIHEPEDHVAALCEVMAMMIAENQDFSTQFTFHKNHIDTWFGQFFEDLSSAKNAVFYRAAGRFGQAFFDLERRYFSMNV